MNLLKLIKNNLFIQNFVANIVSLIPAYFEFSVAKYLAIKKAMLMTAQDNTRGSYLEFGVFTGSSFNFAMKVNKKIEKLGISISKSANDDGVLVTKIENPDSNLMLGDIITEINWEYISVLTLPSIELYLTKFKGLVRGLNIQYAVYKTETGDRIWDMADKRRVLQINLGF